MKRMMIGALMSIVSLSVVAGVEESPSWPFTAYVQSSMSKVISVVPNSPSIKDSTKLITQIWIQAGGSREASAGGGGVAMCEFDLKSSAESRCYGVK